MAIQTRITANANDPVMGSVIITGEIIGNRTRSVDVEAIPNPGYEFVGWDIQKYPIALSVAMYIGGYATNLAGICIGGLTEASTTLYRGDDNLLYEDIFGQNIARDGYWGSGGNAYVVIKSGLVIDSGECSKTGTGGSGGTGGGGGGGALGSICSNDTDCSGTLMCLNSVCSQPASQ
jgi:hypothetical protein